MVKGLVSGIVTGVLVVVAAGFLLSMAIPLPQKPTDTAQTATPQVPVTAETEPASKSVPAVPQAAPDETARTAQPSASADVARANQSGATAPPTPVAPTAVAPTAADPTNTASAVPSASAVAPASGHQPQSTQPQSTLPPPAGQGAGSTLPRSGLGSPVRDQAPGSRISTASIARPETGAPASAGLRPLPDSAPAAPPAADNTVQLPLAAAPSGPTIPASESALADPGLPGRAVQSTAVTRTSPPITGEKMPAMPGRAALPTTIAPPQPDQKAPEVRPTLPQIGGLPESVPAEGDKMSKQRSAAVPSTPAGNASTSVPQSETSKGGLPIVRRPGSEGGTMPGDSARRGTFGQGGIPDVASNGPVVPPPPLIEDRALPMPGFGGSQSGARARRLPQIGGGATAADPSLGTAPADGTEGERTVEATGASVVAAPIPLVRNAEPFDNPEGRPTFAVILRDIGPAGIGQQRLAALDLPVTIAIDPASPDAEAAAKAYRAAGKEVVILAVGLPADATARDVEVNLAAMFNAIPQAVALLDPVNGGFQNDRMRAQQVVRILAGEGYGLVTHDRGLNAAAQLANRDGVPDGRIFRVLDSDQEDEALIRRYLDRAAFRAAQQGQAMVLGDSRATTVAALLGWAMEGRGATVAFAPVSAVLGQP